jgi:TRAP-type uncharacterized transport system substrate-binding protein
MFARFSVLLLVLFAGTAAQAQPKDLRWGGPAVGTSGHKALIALAALLNKEMPQYRIAVLPFPGASDSVKSYALGETDAFYASQVAFHELATDSGRFKGFRAAMKREPLQSFWGFTVEAGMAIRPGDRDTIRSWSDLAAKRAFTCPLNFDTHAHLERAFAALGIKHRYIQVDLSTVGSQLRSGMIDAMCVYTSAESAPPPWLAEASLSADWAALNPSAVEIATLKNAGFSFIGINPSVFRAISTPSRRCCRRSCPASA